MYTGVTYWDNAKENGNYYIDFDFLAWGLDDFQYYGARFSLGFRFRGLSNGALSKLMVLDSSYHYRLECLKWTSNDISDYLGPCSNGSWFRGICLKGLLSPLECQMTFPPSA